MSKVLSLELWVRALAAVADGARHRAVALCFGASIASVSRWQGLAAGHEDPFSKALDSDRRSGQME